MRVERGSEDVAKLEEVEHPSSTRRNRHDAEDDLTALLLRFLLPLLRFSHVAPPRCVVHFLCPLPYSPRSSLGSQRRSRYCA